MAELLFVYGTLKSDGGTASAKPLRLALARHARLVGNAHCRGLLYRVSWFPALVPAPRASQRVYGELYQVLAPGPLLPLLDKFEGFDASSPARSDYLRRKMPVTLENGKTAPAWVYLYNRPVNGLELIESGVF